MLIDVVVDTNIFLHAENTIEQRKAESVNFLERLVQAETSLCVDEGFDWDSEPQNRSHIGSEYHNFIVETSLGYYVLTKLAGDGRIKLVKKKVSTQMGRICNCIKDATDRVFVKVAFNSEERILVSHDTEDLNQRVRERVSEELTVRFVNAMQGSTLLPPIIKADAN